MINDGGSHVIDHSSYSNSWVFIRNVGCNGGEELWEPCSSPGAPTTVEIVDGGNVNWPEALDTSTLIMSGGQCVNFSVSNFATGEISGGSTGWVLASHSATVTITGGSVNSIRSFGGPLIVIRGGQLLSNLDVWATAIFEIHGTEFFHKTTLGDVTPLAYGDVAQDSGYIMGTLESGEPLDWIAIDRSATAILHLIQVPEPSMGIQMIVALAALGVVRVRRR